MPLAGKNSKGKGHTFGVRLSENFAEALRAKARELDIPPTTLAARLLEQVLAEREVISAGPGHKQLAGSDAPQGPAEELRTELGRLRDQLAEALLNRGAGELATDPAPGEEMLRVVQSIAADLQKLRRSQHNATLKVLQKAGGMSADEISDWAKRHLGE